MRRARPMDIWRRIFEFGYQLEMYKPAAKRRWVLRIADLARRPAGGQARCGGGPEGRPAPRRRDPPGRPLGKTASAAVREEIRDLARWLELDVKLPAQAAARTAYQQGASGHRLCLPARAGIEDHSFCQGRVSGLTLSSIVAVNGSP